MTSLLRKGSVSTHHSWPLERIDEYLEIKERVGPGGISSLVVKCLTEWLRKQKGKDEDAVKEPTRVEVPKITATKKELESYMSQLSIEELANMQACGATIKQVATEYWNQKKEEKLSRRMSRIEQIQAALDAEAGRVQT